MQIWKVKNLQKEFPFLGNVCLYLELPLEQIDQVKVEVVDPILLSATGYHNYYKKNGVRKVDYNVFFLIVNDGCNQLKTVFLPFSRRWRNDDCGSNGKSTHGTTIKQQIIIGGYCAALPKFIVQCEGVLDGEDNLRRLIIHKTKNLSPFAEIINMGYEKFTSECSREVK